jgi:hypothetical protein
MKMAFVNWRWLGHGGRLHSDLQAGVGINPRAGSNLAGVLIAKAVANCIKQIPAS